ncbi:MAG: hypothetical protein FWH29_10110 [Methanobrevibacter sp.]|nr:hypothetical protein [Methanobrevibacter sp.]
MSNYLKNLLEEYLSKQKINIDSKNNSIIFNIEKSLPFFQNNLIIKHRGSGKRLSKKIKNKKVELHSDELVNLLKMANMGEIDYLVKNFKKKEVFDIYFKCRFKNFEYVNRIPSPIINKTISIVNEKNKAILIAYTTNGFYLSFFLLRLLFSQKIEYLNNRDSYLSLGGSLKLFEIFEFDEIEICAKNIKTREKRFFKCSYNKNQEKVHFKVKIDFKIIEKDVNSFWKLSIRIKDKGLILGEFLLHGDLLYDKASYEERMFLVKTSTLHIEKSKETSKVVLFLYLFKNFLRLRVSTETK